VALFTRGRPGDPQPGRSAAPEADIRPLRTSLRVGCGVPALPGARLQEISGSPAVPRDGAALRRTSARARLPAIMIDQELVTRKLSLILADVKALTPLARKPLDQYLSNDVDEVLVERYLERIIGRMIDLNYYLIVESGHPPPRDYYESFTLLAKLRVLPAAFASRIASSAGVRNRLVHEYDEIVQRHPVFRDTATSSVTRASRGGRQGHRGHDGSSLRSSSSRSR